MTKQSRLIIFIGASLLMLFSVFWIWVSRASVDMMQINSIIEGGAAPDFSNVCMTGEEAKLSDYEGNVLVLNFWASWCVPCQHEMPTFDKIYQEIKNENISFLMMNVTSKDSQEKAERYVKGKDYTFPVAFDKTNATTIAYQVNSFPTTYVISPEGIICQRTIGIMNEAVLRVAIQECQGESAP